MKVGHDIIVDFPFLGLEGRIPCPLDLLTFEDLEDLEGLKTDRFFCIGDTCGEGRIGSVRFGFHSVIFLSFFQFSHSKFFFSSSSTLVWSILVFPGIKILE